MKRRAGWADQPRREAVTQRFVTPAYRGRNGSVVKYCQSPSFASGALHGNGQRGLPELTKIAPCIHHGFYRAKTAQASNCAIYRFAFGNSIEREQHGAAQIHAPPRQQHHGIAPHLRRPC